VQKNKDIVVEERAPGVIWITIDRAQKHNALARNVLSGIADAITVNANAVPDTIPGLVLSSQISTRPFWAISRASSLTMPALACGFTQ